MTLKRKVSNNSVLVAVKISSAYKNNGDFWSDSFLQYKVIDLCSYSKHDYINSNSSLILILLRACFVHVTI